MSVGGACVAGCAGMYVRARLRKACMREAKDAWKVCSVSVVGREHREWRRCGVRWCGPAGRPADWQVQVLAASGLPPGHGLAIKPLRRDNNRYVNASHRDTDSPLQENSNVRVFLLPAEASPATPQKQTIITIRLTRRSSFRAAFRQSCEVFAI